MKAKNVSSLLLVTFVSLVSMSACGKKSDSSSRQKNSEVESFQGNYGNTRHYSENHFANPNNKYRILPVNHDSALSAGGASKSKFEEYMNLGYGGVVSNVALGDDYLTSDANWELMEEAITYGIEQLGMRVILYDEDYYPSGGARTHTLENAPSDENWEAQGLVHQTKNLVKGEKVTIESLYGHKLIHALVYPQGNLNSLNPEEAVDLLDTYHEGDEYTPSSNGLLVLLYSKNWYEGTHYQNNLMESRRYIDLLKDQPVQEFINNTYEKYYEHFGKYFGKQIESFFFDEPSLPGMYFVPTNASVIDTPDPLIEQYPAVNFDDEIIQKFQAKYGYNPTNYLPYLFEKSNNNDAIRRFRWQYYELIADLVENNFFTQISSWCESHNVNSAGHLLCEEDISDHPLMMGNYMNNYHQMSIPGIDMTHGAASDAISIGANVAKQATSISEFDNKEYTFCEIGQDEGAVSDVNENIANVATLQAMGINYMVSYYKLVNDEDTSRLANSVARINYMLSGNVSDKNVGVYYPIESIYVDETPYNSAGQRIYTGSWGFNEYVTAINENYRTLLQSLVKNQIDYSIFSAYMLLNSEIRDGAIVTPNGQKFTTFILPKSTALDDGIIDKLIEAKNNGVNVVVQDVNRVLSKSSDKQIEFDEKLETLKTNNSYVINNTSINSLLSTLNTIEGIERVNLMTPNSNIVARKQTNGDGLALYMLVNTSNKEQTITLKCDEVGSEYQSWDVYEGVVDGMAVKVKDGSSYITVKLPAFNVGIYTIS